ncbi:hypothetical protein Tdes44962_MAKER09598 [Teratosphaeria destructans]|uniref:Uncharacterized protein n=1 Tax=Teratosphaeria destructans TaxID=418781 RepID=A0A9W7SSI2_9PEZI|nr:hypothetical protein Tdes44962_MAKER09598 [Teratosphaeria destructans]
MQHCSYRRRGEIRLPCPLICPPLSHTHSLSLTHTSRDYLHIIMAKKTTVELSPEELQRRVALQEQMFNESRQNQERLRVSAPAAAAQTAVEPEAGPAADTSQQQAGDDIHLPRAPQQAGDDEHLPQAPQPAGEPARATSTSRSVCPLGELYARFKDIESRVDNLLPFTGEAYVHHESAMHRAVSLHVRDQSDAGAREELIAEYNRIYARRTDGYISSNAGMHSPLRPAEPVLTQGSGRQNHVARRTIQQLIPPQLTVFDQPVGLLTSLPVYFAEVCRRRQPQPSLHEQREEAIWKCRVRYRSATDGLTLLQQCHELVEKVSERSRLPDQSDAEAAARDGVREKEQKRWA